MPTESDFGSETWGNQSFRGRIGNNVWAFTLTVDEERGLVYMPVSSPGSNFYGCDRPGEDLFANSTIAMDICGTPSATTTTGPRPPVDSLT